jgi:hypothetical protein
MGDSNQRQLQDKKDLWDDQFLDRMREIGDPLADQAVAAVLDGKGIEEVHRLMKTLVLNDQPPPDSLPPEIKDYLAETEIVEPPALPRIKIGEDLFAEHGPEILMLLGCYSLPAAYAASKGVQVLYRTGYLLNRPNRRLFETTQMLIDVMTPGGLGVAGKGVRTAQKVRLMHAAIRHLILQDKDNPWDPELGCPINQEDLVATLMIFSYLVIDGLEKIGVSLQPESSEAYLDAWREVGRIMGVREDLLPANMAEAKFLTEKIQSRQVTYSPEGEKMTQALLEMMEEDAPHIFRDVPSSLMRLFLPPDVADFLGVPNHKFEKRLIEFEVHFSAKIEHLIGTNERRRGLIRIFNLHLIQWFVNVDRGGKRARFEIPDHFRRKWDYGVKEENLSFWQRLVRWLRLRFKRQ